MKKCSLVWGLMLLVAVIAGAAPDADEVPAN
jgi:hypothetical protein